MWDLRSGQPAPGAGTLEACELLKSAFRDLPGAMDHPGLLHLHVHLMEMSPHPEAALVTGDRLREISPDMGHLVHMPTHIDIQCGHYRDAMHWNQKAIIADRKFYDRAGPMNFYSGYRIHNYHFAAYGAMFLGQYTPAIAAADELIETMPEAFLRIPSPPMADFFEGYVVHPAARPGPFRQMARDHCAGSAGGSRPVLQHRRDDALWQGHRARRAGRRRGGGGGTGPVPCRPRNACRSTRQIHNVPCVQLLAIAEEMLEGEIAYRRGEHDSAFARLRAAIALEDGCPTTNRGVGCSRSATRWARCCWSKAGPRKPNWCIARTSAWAARCPGRRSIRTISGPCAGSGLPGSARRDRGGHADPPACGLRRCPRGHAGVGVLLLRAREAA